MAARIIPDAKIPVYYCAQSTSIMTKVFTDSSVLYDIFICCMLAYSTKSKVCVGLSAPVFKIPNQLSSADLSFAFCFLDKSRSLLPMAIICFEPLLPRSIKILSLSGSAFDSSLINVASTSASSTMPLFISRIGILKILTSVAGFSLK